MSPGRARAGGVALRGRALACRARGMQVAPVPAADPPLGERWRAAAAEARSGLPARPEDWGVREVGKWAEALAGGPTGRALECAGVDGECLLGLPDVFDKCGLPLPSADGRSAGDVGGLFRLRRARLALAHPWQRMALDPSIAAVLGIVPAGGSAEAWAARPMEAGAGGMGSSGERDGDEENGGLSSLFGAASATLASRILRRASLTKEEKAVPGVPGLPGPRPAALKSVPAKNLTKDAANARINQAKLLGGTVVAVELVCSLAGTVTVWPHLVAVLPGALAVQQGITGAFETCFITAIAAVAVEDGNGAFSGA